MKLGELLKVVDIKQIKVYYVGEVIQPTDYEHYKDYTITTIYNAYNYIVVCIA